MCYNMGILDEYKAWFRSFSSEWIRINDKFSGWTIEDFSYGELRCVTLVGGKLYENL